MIIFYSKIRAKTDDGQIMSLILISHNYEIESCLKSAKELLLSYHTKNLLRREKNFITVKIKSNTIKC